MKVDVPAIVRQVDDEAGLVAEAKAARREAEEAEEAGSPSRWREADIYAELANRGWSQRKIAHECGTSASTVNRFIQAVLRYRNADGRPRFWDAYASVTGEKAVHVSHNSGENEWYTPPEYIAQAKKVLGQIDLDPASSEVANQTVGANVFFTIADNGLEKDWAGSVWLNPPYGVNLVDKFVSKLCRHIQDGGVRQAVLLTNNATESKWFQEALKVCTAICFPAHRVRFLDSEGNPSKLPLQGQSMLYFGDRATEFVKAFEQFGFCVPVNPEG
jgi:ParB family chromosome partitioning protein